MARTNVELKEREFDKFIELVKKQFQHGGDKYKLESGWEITDLITEIEPNWIMGTIMKYVGRYMNFKRERDLLKIATYVYIQWLIDDGHLRTEHDEDTDIQKEDVEDGEMDKQSNLIKS